MTRGKSPGCSNRGRPAKVREPRGGKGGEGTTGWYHQVWLTLIRFRSVSSCLPIVCVLGLASFAMSPSLYSLVGSMPTPGVIKARPCASTDESRAERLQPLIMKAHARAALTCTWRKMVSCSRGASTATKSRAWEQRADRMLSIQPNAAEGATSGLRAASLGERVCEGFGALTLWQRSRSRGPQKVVSASWPE